MQRTIFDLSNDGFVIVGPGGDIRQINPSAERLFEIRAEETVGQPVERLFSTFTPLYLEPTRRGVRNDPNPTSFHRVHGRREDGSQFPLEMTVERISTPEESLTVLCMRRPIWVRSSPGGERPKAAGIDGFGYWSRDLTSNVISVSDEMLALIGVDKHAAANRAIQFSDHLHPDDKIDFQRAIDRTLATGERMDLTHRVLTSDGAVRVVRSVGELRLDAGGRPSELLGITFDVTERERVEEALRESENTLSAIVNSTTAMIYIKDTDGKYLLVNRHFEEVFGVDNRDLRGKTDFEFLPDEVATSVRANDRRVREAGRAVEFEEVVPHQEEEHIYISIKFPLRRSTGEIYAVCGISTDITARKRAESELENNKRSLERIVEERTATLRDTNRRLQEEIVERKETASQLQRLIDTAREGIWVVDKDGNTTFANPRMGEILGYEPSEMIGRPIFDFMAEERRNEAEANLERRRRGISEDHDFELQRKDGSKVWALLSTGPVQDKDGQMTGALAMVTDITERKHAEEYQALLLQELDHRVKNTLATVAALSDLTMGGASSIEEFSQAFDGRIQAMARTHEALARSKWMGVSFEELADLVLAPVRTSIPSRISVSGNPGRLAPNTISPLALTLNELGTNALKHGSLSDSDGCVRLECELAENGNLSLTWRESGGPPVRATPSEGTGLHLIRGLIEYELGGSLHLDFDPEGLVCHVNIPTQRAG